VNVGTGTTFAGRREFESHIPAFGYEGWTPELRDSAARLWIIKPSFEITSEHEQSLKIPVEEKIETIVAAG
jgi:hypothetical protein